MMYLSLSLSLSLDHRVIDGAMGAAFLVRRHQGLRGAGALLMFDLA
jgi:pyruvate/2-oxoglutarate dehydrogenase complex dihydrolipoamide acyltransferase (E2) component